MLLMYMLKVFCLYFI